MLQTIEFNGLPEGVKIQIGSMILVGTQSINPNEEKKESA